MFPLVNKIKRYLSIPLLFLKQSGMSQLEYRFEFLTWTIVSVLWIGLTLVIVQLVFGQVNAVAGWTKDQVLLVVAISGIFTSLLWMFVTPSLENLSDNIRTGNFDFYLTKPINSRFLASVSKYDVDNITRVCVLIYYILFSLGIWYSGLPLLSVTGFFLAFIMGIIIFYNLFFIMITSSFWLIDLSNISDLFDNLMSVGKYPTYIFEGSLKFIFFLIVPVVFVATFPAQFLIGKSDPKILLLGIILVIVSSLFSQWFWNFALKRYSSASS